MKKGDRVRTTQPTNYNHGGQFTPQGARGTVFKITPTKVVVDLDILGTQAVSPEYLEIDPDPSLSRLHKFLVENAETDGCLPENAVRDNLTELMHLCDELNLDFDTLLHNAEEVYDEEKELAGDNPQ